MGNREVVFCKAATSGREKIGKIIIGTFTIATTGAALYATLRVFK
jgi:hypothetical protein